MLNSCGIEDENIGNEHNDPPPVTQDDGVEEISLPLNDETDDYTQPDSHNHDNIQKEEISINNIVHDQDGVKVTIESLTIYTGLSSYGAEMIIHVDNNSESSIITKFDWVYANDIRLDSAYLSIRNGSGTNETGVAEFPRYELTERGIDVIGELVFVLEITNETDWTYQYTQPITIQSSVTENIKRPQLATQRFLFEQDDISISLIDTTDRYIGSTITINLLIENNMEREIVVLASDAKVNDNNIEALASISSILPGKMAINQISFSNSDLEEIKINDITDIEKLAFDLAIYDSEALVGFFINPGTNNEHYVLNTGMLEIIS